MPLVLDSSGKVRAKSFSPKRAPDLLINSPNQDQTDNTQEDLTDTKNDDLDKK